MCKGRCGCDVAMDDERGGETNAAPDGFVPCSAIRATDGQASRRFFKGLDGTCTAAELVGFNAQAL